MEGKMCVNRIREELKMKLKSAGAHRLRYIDYKGVERLEWV